MAAYSSNTEILTEILLDARELEPPEPFERACDILAQLKPGEYLKMLHRRIPYPLLASCASLSLQHVVTALSPEQYQVVIFFDSDCVALKKAGLL